MTSKTNKLPQLCLDEQNGCTANLKGDVATSLVNKSVGSIMANQQVLKCVNKIQVITSNVDTTGKTPVATSDSKSRIDTMRLWASNIRAQAASISEQVKQHPNWDAMFNALQGPKKTSAVRTGANKFTLNSGAEIQVLNITDSTVTCGKNYVDTKATEKKAACRTIIGFDKKQSVTALIRSEPELEKWFRTEKTLAQHRSDIAALLDNNDPHTGFNIFVKNTGLNKFVQGRAYMAAFALLTKIDAISEEVEINGKPMKPLARFLERFDKTIPPGSEMSVGMYFRNRFASIKTKAPTAAGAKAKAKAAPGGLSSLLDEALPTPKTESKEEQQEQEQHEPEQHEPEQHEQEQQEQQEQYFDQNLQIASGKRNPKAEREALETYAKTNTAFGSSSGKSGAPGANAGKGRKGTNGSPKNGSPAGSLNVTPKTAGGFDYIKTKPASAAKPSVFEEEDITY